MNIVIAGAGEVGTHLAKMLSNEDHDIVLMDEDEEILSQLSSQLDLLTVTGFPQSFRDLRSTGVEKADLFIAVTPYEERNVISCMMAKDMGAKKTLARINNGEYLKGAYKEKLHAMGIDELIYPESLAGNEVASSVRQVGTRQLIEFSEGKLLLLGIKLHENAPILNKTFSEISSQDVDFRAVAINRHGETIIPRGKDVVMLGDIVFFITTPDKKARLFEMTGKEIFPVKDIMILGGSRIGQRAVEKLGDGYNIKIIEIDKARSEKIADKLENALVINGDGRNLELLREEHLKDMDAFVAVTGSSEANILACHLAKKVGVRRTVAEVENNEFLGIAESMDIGSLINKKLIAASYIYKYTLGAKVAQAKCLTAVEAEAFELIITEGTKVTRKKVKDLDFPADATLGGLVRDDQASIISGETQLQAGDKVVVFAMRSGLKKLKKFFK